MYDPNVFAILVPFDKRNLARDAFRLDHNSRFYHRAISRNAEELPLDSRNSTPSPELHSDGYENCVDRILLTFDQMLRNPGRGWQFGTDHSRCDILLGLPKTRGISRQHLSIQVDENLCVWLHDQSTHGIAVGYDDQSMDELRKKEKWILSFMPSAQQSWKDVTIYVPKENGLAFKIKFPNHADDRLDYLANVRAHVKDSKTALPIGDFDIESDQTTAAPSPLLAKPPFYINDKIIGQGSFGEVRRVVNAHNGLVYAAKYFKLPLERRHHKKRKRDEEVWRTRIQNEIYIMKNNQHVSAGLS